MTDKEVKKEEVEPVTLDEETNELRFENDDHAVAVNNEIIEMKKYLGWKKALIDPLLGKYECKISMSFIPKEGVTDG